MIKRFNPDFSLSISHEIAWMRETPEGGYVAHGDYATLFSELEVVKAERDALAVENANQRDWMNKCSELWDAGCELDDLLGLMPETPATSAALAAIEARGVEKYAADLDQIASESNPAEPKHTVASSYADDARLFAKKLREAK